MHSVVKVYPRPWNFLHSYFLHSYIIQGLFHPARRVRECYWRIYNNLYLGAQVSLFDFFAKFWKTLEPKFKKLNPFQDAIVPAFPRVPDDEKNQYVRYELEYHL